MFNRIKSIAVIPGRLASSAGTSIFGAVKFLTYAYHPNPQEHRNFYGHPVTITTVAANVIINMLTRIPAMFRKKKDSNPQAQTNVTPSDYETERRPAMLSDEEVIVGDGQQEVEAGQIMEQAIVEEKRARCSCSLFLNILCKASNILSTFAVGIGSYNAGKVLCEFVAGVSQDPNAPVDPVRYYLVNAIAIYLAISNMQIYVKYVVVSVNNNRDKLNHAKLYLLNKKAASSAVILASLNIISSAAFNFMSTTSSLRGVNQDIRRFPSAHAPEWLQMPNEFIIGTGTALGIAGFVNEAMTSIPSLYSNIEPLIEDVSSDEPLAKEVKEPRWKKITKAITYSVGAVDAVSTGAQNYAAISMTAGDLFKVNPYGYIVDFSFLCALSKSACHFSFFIKKGIDDAIKDAEELVNKRAANRAKPQNEEAAPLNINNSVPTYKSTH